MAKEVRLHLDGLSGGHRRSCKAPLCILEAQLLQNGNAELQMRAIKDINGAVWQKHSGLSRA